MRVLWFFIYSFLVLGTTSNAHSKDQGSAYYQGSAKIDAIHAHLFFDHKGKISEDILAKNDIYLWNTVIGEGYAGGNPSTSTYVVIEISGQDIDSTRRAKVNIVVTNSKGAQIINITRGYSMYNAYKKSYIPLIVPDTGCERITISAKLIGKGFDPSSVSQTVPYNCGE